MALKKYHVSLNLLPTAVSDWEQGGISSTTGTETVSTVRLRTKDYYPIENDTDYYISVNDTDYCYVNIILYNSSMEYLGQYFIIDMAINGATALAINIPSSTIANVAYYRVVLKRQDDNTILANEISNVKPMLNLGNTPLPYEPYGNSWNDIPYRRYETATDTVTNLPVTLYTDGQPVSSYTIKGNTQTSGTPSPQNPVTIEGVGEETANLLNRDTGVNGYLDYEGNFITPHANLYTSDYIVIPAGAEYVTQSFDSTSGMVSPAMCFYDSTKTFISGEAFSGELIKTFTVPNNAYFLRTCYRSTFPWVMLNVGNTALPYEPYGYKISILKDLSPLTPMYFSQQLMQISEANAVDSYVSTGTATYNTYKLALTGDEAWDISLGVFYLGTLPVDYLRSSRNITYMSTHYVAYQQQSSAGSVPDGKFGFGDNGSVQRLYVHDSSYSTVQDFKAFLAAQYANGTPVTIYYVRATPTTESVTAPTITTTGGEVSIDVDTTVKPSELDLTYHGWHTHEPLKRENGQWV